jgi:hypothetical protein
MPGFDGTGPMGQGAMTGGGRGYCAVTLNSAGVRPFGRRGSYGRGGRGFRNCFYSTGFPGRVRGGYYYTAFGAQTDPYLYPYGNEVTPKQEADILKNEAKALKEQLKDIQYRIETLEKAQAQESKD